MVPGCKNPYKKIPERIRREWLKAYRVFLCDKSRCCDEHLSDSNLVHKLSKTSSFSPKQQKDLHELRDAIKDDDMGSILRSNCKQWTGLSRDEVMSLLNELPSISCKRKGYIVLFTYLIKLRTGESDDRIATLLNLERSSVSKYLKVARSAVSLEFTPNHLGFRHLNRHQLIERHTPTSKLLFGNNVVLIWDGTYIYIQKSGNHDFQRKAYSMQKHRCLVKPMMVVTPDEYIVEVYGSFKATENDATILNRIMNSPDSPRNFLRENDTFLLDRGFRDSLRTLRQAQINGMMPSFISSGNTQLTWKEANQSRRVTRCRYAIEKVNGYMKTRFKLFNNTQYNTTLPHLDTDFRNAAAIYNTYYYTGYNDEKTNEDEMLANLLIERLNQPNDLARLVKSELRCSNNRNKAIIFAPTNRQSLQFPILSETDLQLISLGKYQIDQARKYLFDNENGDFDLNLHIANTTNVDINKYVSSINDPQLIRGNLKSRHSNSSKYYVFILLDGSLTEQGLYAIRSYYCDCKNGNRTAGCCSHVMCLLWFLGFGQHNLENLKKVGAGLDQFFGNAFPGKCEREAFKILN